MYYNVLYAVGEPLNKEAWSWYNDVAGEKRCTVVDTYWQTGKLAMYRGKSNVHYYRWL